MRMEYSLWIRNSVSLLALLAFITGCGEKKSSSLGSGMLENSPVVATWQKVNTDQVLVGETKLLKDTLTIPLSSLVEDLQLVRLDNRDEALIKGERVFASDHYMLLHNEQQQPVKLFDREGKYLNDIGRIGQGPNEYASTIYHAQIDEANNRIYLVSWIKNSKILVYDLKGNGYPSIPLAYQAPKMTFHVDKQKGVIYAGALLFEGSNTPVFWVQDLEGNVLKEVDGKPFEVVPDFSNELLFSVTSEKPSFFIEHYPPAVDSLYRYDEKENRLIPYYTTEHSEKELPNHRYFEFMSYILGSSTYFAYAGDRIYKPLPPKHYLIDPGTGKGSYIRVINDFLDNARVEYFTYNATGEYFTENYDPGDLLDKIKARLASPAGLTEEQKATLTKLSKSITVDDNNILLIGRFKESISPTTAPVTLTIKQSAALDKPVRKKPAASSNDAAGPPPPPPPVGTPPPPPPPPSR